MTGRYRRSVAAGAAAGRRVLRSSVLRTSALLGVAVFGLVVGVAAVAARERNGWWVVLGCAPLTLFLCLLLVRPNRLELDDSNFTTVNPFGRRSRVEWRDCGPFRAKRTMTVTGHDALLPRPIPIRIRQWPQGAQKNSLVGRVGQQKVKVSVGLLPATDR